MYSRGALVWSEAEDRRLIKTLINDGNVRWVDIAESMPGRTGENCRDRWHKYLLKMARYSDAIPDHVRNMRRRGKAKAKLLYESEEEAEKDSEEEDDLLARAAETAVADVFGTDVFGVQLPATVSPDDKFSFEEMMDLGAMSHIALPVAPSLPSPASMTALPTFEQLVAHEVLAPAAHKETASSSPGALATARITMRVVPKVNILANAKATGIVVNVFTERNFQAINAMLARPLARPIARPIIKNNKMAAPKMTGVVFNAMLVRSMA